MGRILFVIFIAMPLLEIAGFVLVGNAVGLWATLGGVLLSGLAGALILRWQGLSLLNEMRSTMGRGQVPARAIADAMMVALAGLLLLIPGYFSDLVGLLLLVPPVRGAIYNFLRSRVTVVSTQTTSYGFTPRQLDDDTIELSEDEYRPN